MSFNSKCDSKMLPLLEEVDSQNKEDSTKYYVRNTYKISGNKGDDKFISHKHIVTYDHVKNAAIALLNVDRNSVHISGYMRFRIIDVYDVLDKLCKNYTGTSERKILTESTIALMRKVSKGFDYQMLMNSDNQRLRDCSINDLDILVPIYLEYRDPEYGDFDDTTIEKMAEYIDIIGESVTSFWEPDVQCLVKFINLYKNLSDEPMIPFSAVQIIFLWAYHGWAPSPAGLCKIPFIQKPKTRLYSFDELMMMMAYFNASRRSVRGHMRMSTEFRTFIKEYLPAELCAS